MAESSPLDLAVRLFIASGRQLRTWTITFVAANGALLALLAALIAWGDPAEGDLRLFNDILMAICLLGALTSVMLGGAIYRQQRWSGHLLGRIRLLQDPQTPLLASDATPPEGAIAAALTLASAFLIASAWIALLVFIPLLGAIVETSVTA